MNLPIDLVTDVQPLLTPEAAAILAHVIRKAVADRQHRPDRGPSTTTSIRS